MERHEKLWGRRNHKDISRSQWTSSYSTLVDVVVLSYRILPEVRRNAPNDRREKHRQGWNTEKLLMLQRLSVIISSPALPHSNDKQQHKYYSQWVVVNEDFLRDTLLSSVPSSFSLPVTEGKRAREILYACAISSSAESFSLAFVESILALKPDSTSRQSSGGRQIKNYGIEARLRCYF